MLFFITLVFWIASINSGAITAGMIHVTKDDSVSQFQWNKTKNIFRKSNLTTNFLRNQFNPSSIWPLVLFSSNQAPHNQASGLSNHQLSFLSWIVASSMYTSHFSYGLPNLEIVNINEDKGGLNGRHHHFGSRQFLEYCAFIIIFISGNNIMFNKIH